jgi:outer membrane protein TolC
MKNPAPSIIPILLLVFLANSVVAADQKPADELSKLVAVALADNPELKASDSRWRMYREKVAQASSFDDPMLMLKIQNGVLRDPFDFGRDSMTQKVVGISQQLPFWGKRRLKGDVARQESEVYRWTLEERKVELTRMVKQTWYQLYLIDRETDIVERNIRILDDFITLAETRYSVNQGPQTDVFKAQVEHSKLLDARITLEQQRKSAVANLNTLLARPAETPVGRVPDFEIRPVKQTAEELRAEAFANRPLMKSLAAQVGKGEAGMKLADREYYPDFNLFAEYMQRDPAMGSDGDDMYSVGVSFNLPVQRAKRHAAVAEANSEVAMAASELESLKNSIGLAITDLMAQLERRKKLVELYGRGIIPQAENTLESATINYRVNKVDFLTLLDSRLTLFNYQRDYFESMAEYGIKRAELEAVLGKQLD